MKEGSLLFIISNFDGLTPVNVTPKRRANIPANDMKAETLPLFSAFVFLNTYVARQAQLSRESLSCAWGKNITLARN